VGVNKVHIVKLLKEKKRKINTSLYLVVQTWTSIRKKEKERRRVQIQLCYCQLRRSEEQNNYS
jgi:hypothetical protein